MGQLGVLSQLPLIRRARGIRRTASNNPRLSSIDRQRAAASREDIVDLHSEIGDLPLGLHRSVARFLYEQQFPGFDRFFTRWTTINAEYPEPAAAYIVMFQRLFPNSPITYENVTNVITYSAMESSDLGKAAWGSREAYLKAAVGRLFAKYRPPRQAQAEATTNNQTAGEFSVRANVPAARARHLWLKEIDAAIRQIVPETALRLHERDDLEGLLDVPASTASIDTGTTDNTGIPDQNTHDNLDSVKAQSDSDDSDQGCLLPPSPEDFDLA